MLLEGKNAVIFAANGMISKGVARAMTRNGANVHLAAHRPDDLGEFVDELKEMGRTASVAQVDATAPDQVRAHVDDLAAKLGHIDITFNGIGGRPAELGYPARSDETPLQDFLLPIDRIVGSQFLTSREVARVMAEQGSGAILTLSATLSGGAFAYMAGISAACGAVEAMTNALAGEFGPSGVRVNCVRGSAMPETRTIQETGAGQAALRGAPPEFATPVLGRMITVDETANAAVFLASDLASGMTAQMVTVCAGQFPTTI